MTPPSSMSSDIALEILTKPDDTQEMSWYTHGTGTDEQLALERNGSNFYYHADGLGSITAIVGLTFKADSQVRNDRTVIIPIVDRL